jgi:hypothetical protein
MHRYILSLIKDHTYTPPIPLSLAELQDEISHAIAALNTVMVQHTEEELQYCHAIVA